MKRFFFTLGAFCLSLLGAPKGYSFSGLSYDSHCVTSIYPDSHLIALEDGSKWHVSSQDFYSFFSWGYKNFIPIEITPTSSSSRFNYYLTDIDTGLYVRANLVEAPFRESPFAVTLLGMSLEPYFYEGSSLYLSNGTFWRVSASDIKELETWYKGDLIIIGKNNEWLSFNTHILINIHTNKFVRAQRI